MGEFKREPRYVVFKINDLQRYCSDFNIGSVEHVGRIIADGRARDGKIPFNAVVVEQDWPEFEMVWDAIEARMTGKATESDVLKLRAALKEAMEWNWIDEDVPPNVVAMCEGALTPNDGGNSRE